MLGLLLLLDWLLEWVDVAVLVVIISTGIGDPLALMTYACVDMAPGVGDGAVVV